MKDSFKLCLLTLAGTLFAGYLGLSKLFTGECTLSTSCSYFLGYPTCYYGFGMFGLMLVLSIIYFFTNKSIYAKAIAITATLGVIFSGYFSVKEILPMFTEGVTYGLILPSCSYGLLVYLIVLYLAYKNSEV
jgi:uncharacterized membrane protein